MTTGQVGEDMFIVLSGELELTNEPLGLNERLGPGASEGELFAFGIAPMSEGYETQDASLFAEWGADMLKVDACGDAEEPEVLTKRWAAALGDVPWTPKSPLCRYNTVEEYD